MATAILKALNVEAREERTALDPFVRTKQKLLANLRQQLKAAEAMVEGRAYMVPRVIAVEEDGVRVRKQISKPIRAWYWRDSGGQVRFSVRIANRPIEIDKGKTDIIVGEDGKLPEVISVVIQAVEAGELDKVIAASMRSRKAA